MTPKHQRQYSNFTFFLANEYFFFVLTSNSALRPLLGLISLVSFKSRSENLKTQASRSSPWSGEVKEGIWFGCSKVPFSYLSPRKQGRNNNVSLCYLK